MALGANDILNIATSRYGDKLYWFVRRMVVSHDDAEDALQECFTNCNRTRLFQTVDSLSEELSEELAAESAPDADRTSVLFQKALLQLTTQQRLAFNLRYYDELSYAQITSITGKSENTLRTNYHYAVEKIKEYLKEHAI